VVAREEAPYVAPVGALRTARLARAARSRPAGADGRRALRVAVRACDDARIGDGAAEGLGGTSLRPALGAARGNGDLVAEPVAVPLARA
jgi:hypothetical protein